MKKILLMIAFVAGLSTLVKAQQAATPPKPEEITKKSVDELDKRLKLNATQKSIIYNFTFSQVKEQQELIKQQNNGGDNEQTLSRFYKLQDETSKNIRAVLKDDQQKEYDKMVQERLNGKDSKKKRKNKKNAEDDIVTDLPGISKN
ncbi:MAG: hypothetical protein ACOH2A_13445 [Sphingobacteriaceae bacterium]